MAGHFYTSEGTPKDIGIDKFVDPTGDHDEFSRHWFVHRIVIERLKCFIIMETHTRTSDMGWYYGAK